MKRLSVSRLGSTDSYEQSGVICRHISTQGIVRVLRLSVSHPGKDIVSPVRWNVNLSYVVSQVPATATFRGNGSSVPGVGNVFGKV